METWTILVKEFRGKDSEHNCNSFLKEKGTTVKRVQSHFDQAKHEIIYVVIYSEFTKTKS